MIETIIGIYLVAWWGVFWLLIPPESPFRFWAFFPAAICAFTVPCLVLDFVSNPDMGIGLWAAGGILPFGIVTGLLIRRWRKRKGSANHTSGIRQPADGLSKPSM
jgi:hypothetical protein